MSRKRPLNKLSKCPLTLVLCQVRFSPIPQMREKYLPEIQDRLRHAGYKIDASAKIQQVAMNAVGSTVAMRDHCEVQKMDRRSSVVVAPDFVVFQTTDYDTFDDFLPRLIEATEIVNSVVGGIAVQRIGLRYIDLIRETEMMDWTRYLRKELHGIGSRVFLNETVEQVHQTVGSTNYGKLVLRIWQNRVGAALPPDVDVFQLVLPKHAQGLDTEKGLATIIDTDHYCDGLSEEFSVERLKDLCWSLRNDITEIFEDSVVTPEALEEWK